MGVHQRLKPGQGGSWLTVGTVVYEVVGVGRALLVKAPKLYNTRLRHFLGGGKYDLNSEMQCCHKTLVRINNQ